MIYVAHPLAGDIAGNCDRAERWLAALMRDNPDETFCLPWVSYVRAGLHLFGSTNPDGNKEFRDRCLRDDLRIAAECDGIVLCGPRVSPGMALELEAAIGWRGPAEETSSWPSYVWRFVGVEPPTDGGSLVLRPSAGHGHLRWARQLLADVRAGVER